MSKRKSRNKTKWVLRCPICSSDRNVLWLGGAGGLPVRKCLDCGYIGAAFIEVEEASVKDWKLWAAILLVGLLLGMTTGILIVELVGSCLVWLSLFAGLDLYRRSKRVGALAYNIALVCAVSGFLLIMVGKITGIQTMEGLGIGLFGLAAIAGVQLHLRRAWEEVKVVDNHEIKE